MIEKEHADADERQDEDKTSGPKPLLFVPRLRTGPFGVTAFDAADAVPVPSALIAATLNVYVALLASPVTVPVVSGELNVVDFCGV